LVVEAGSTEGNGVRARQGRRNGDSAGFATGRGQADTLELRRWSADFGHRDIATGGGRAAARDRRAPGRLHRGPACARAGSAYARRNDPIPGLADRGRLATPTATIATRCAPTR